MINLDAMFKLREYRPADFNFIASSYLRSYRSGPEAQHMPNDFYYPEYKERLMHMLSTGTVKIACSIHDDDQIIGYSITGNILSWNIIHYVYVKYTFRKIGLTKALLAHIPLGINVTICTHLPKLWSLYSTKYKLAFDPKYARPQ